MAKKKIKIDTDKFDVDLEKDGTNIKLDIDTKAVDIKILKDSINKEFHLDSKNIDIDIKKTPDNLEVKVEATGPMWKIIAKKIARFIMRKLGK